MLWYATDESEFESKAASKLIDYFLIQGLATPFRNIIHP